MSTTGGFEPTAQDDLLATDEPAKTRSWAGGRKWIALGVGLAVAASAGVGFAAGSVVGGGGTQPEDVLPDTVVAYLDVDLDPPAQQKLNLVRLLGRFSDVEREYGSEPDIRTVVVDWLVDGTDLQDADVAAWVGDRVGLGLSWDSEAQALTPVAALQVTDEDEAVADLSQVLGSEQIAVVDGYVVATGDLLGEFAALDEFDSLIGDAVPGAQTAAEIVAAGESAPLSESASFVTVFDHLDDGLLTAYLDGAAIDAAGKQLVESLELDVESLVDGLPGVAESGQAGAVLRAEPNALEWLAWTSADPAPGTVPAEVMPNLPESTLFALELTGGSELVAERWDQAIESAEQGGLTQGEIDRELAELEAQYGIVLPDDLQTLAGDDVVLAVDGEGLLTSVPGIGLRSMTDPTAGAELASKIESALASLTGGFGITARGTPDGMVIATTEDYAAQLLAGDGSLGTDPTYQEALPDSDGASYLVWVDLAAVRAFTSLAAPDAAGVIDPLEAFGVSVRPDDGGSLVRARLVFDEPADS